jgi:hypothetical protein
LTAAQLAAFDLIAVNNHPARLGDGCIPGAGGGLGATTRPASSCFARHLPHRYSQALSRSEPWTSSVRRRSGRGASQARRGS